MGKGRANKNYSNFFMRLLAFVLFVLTLIMFYSGIVMVYSTYIINILLISTGLFSLLTFIDLVDRINRFGKYGEDKGQCQKDHSQSNGPCGFGDENTGFGCCPDGKSPSDQYPRINECPNEDFQDCRDMAVNQSAKDTPDASLGTKKPDDSEYTKYED